MQKWAIGATLFALWAPLACGPEATIEPTGPPDVGTVRAQIVSTFRSDDVQPGIDLPAGIRVTVQDGIGAPLSDAVVRLHAGEGDPQDMRHQGNGEYELDVLGGRLSPPEREYLFEVESEFLEPPRVVLRVEHEFLTQFPEIGTPADRTEHTEGEPLSVIWLGVEGADCYDVGVREHELQSWTWIHECIDSTTAALDGEVMREISFIRVRARHTVGDETFETSDIFSQSTSSSDVQIFLMLPEG